MQPPTTLKQVCAFLGLVGYYRKFIKGFTKIAKPLMLQEHNGTEFPIAFLLHTFTKTQRKWSTTEQEAYGVYYAITKWNYYLEGTNITVKMIINPL